MTLKTKSVFTIEFDSAMELLYFLRPEPGSIYIQIRIFYSTNVVSST
jgi:hypothetical protein